MQRLAQRYGNDAVRVISEILSTSAEPLIVAYSQCPSALMTRCRGAEPTGHLGRLGRAARGERAVDVELAGRHRPVAEHRGHMNPLVGKTG